MDKKKIGVFGGLFISLITMVSAYSYGPTLLYFSGPRDFMQRGIDFFTNLFGPILYVLLGGTTWTGEFLFEKLLILIMLIGLIYIILGYAVPMFKNNENSKVKWIIAVVIPLIAIRNIQPSWLSGILLQNVVLVVALSSFLPFLIYFLFLENVGRDSHSVRVVGWVLFIVVYIGVWSTSSTEIADYYLLTLIVAAACLIFDGTIQKYYLKQQLKEAGHNKIMDRLSELDKEYKKIYESSSIPDEIKKPRLKALDKEIKFWQKKFRTGL